MPHLERGDQRPDYHTFLAAHEQAWQRFQQAPTPRNLALLQTSGELLTREIFRPGRSALGLVVSTPGALEAMRSAGHIPPEFLQRHKHGDWGELDDHDRGANEWALVNGARLLSAYSTWLSEKLWVITEADRSATTHLLPGEY